MKFQRSHNRPIVFLYSDGRIGTPKMIISPTPSTFPTGRDLARARVYVRARIYKGCTHAYTTHFIIINIIIVVIGIVLTIQSADTTQRPARFTRKTAANQVARRSSRDFSRAPTVSGHFHLLTTRPIGVRLVEIGVRVFVYQVCKVWR